MPETKTVVYEPPELGLPYLAAVISPEGEISVFPFVKKEDADAKAEELRRSFWSSNNALRRSDASLGKK